MVDRIEIVTAAKPATAKADVEIVVGTKPANARGISIKLVSENGFNQIDKRWLAHYVKMWNTGGCRAGKLFVGETPPDRPPSKGPSGCALNNSTLGYAEGRYRFFTANKG